MSKIFDTTTKHLLELGPSDWLRFLGIRPTGAVGIIDADLGSVIAEADKVLCVSGPQPWLVQIELQASYDPALGDRLLEYNVLLHRRHEMPVQSVLVLLRPKADGPAMTGIVEHRLPDGRRNHEFTCDIIRCWQQPAEVLLGGGLATLPLAPLTNVTEDQVASVIRRMDERVNREAPPQLAATLWTATFSLMGLRFPPELARKLLRGAVAMKESTTYQAVLEEGREEGLEKGLEEGRAQGKTEEARQIILRQGSKRFGEPDARTRAAVEAAGDLARLERMIDRMLDASSWDDLLNTP